MTRRGLLAVAVLAAAATALSVRRPGARVEAADVPARWAGGQAKPAEAELRQRLSALQYEVTQHAATEPAFLNSYWDNHERGLYVDVVSGEPLFSSHDKFDSGTGWPSFTRPVEESRIVSQADHSHGLDRTEVRSAAAGSHLGHVFEHDTPTGLRYCINSAALRFVPEAKLAAQGYGRYLPVLDGRPPAPEPAAVPAAAAKPARTEVAVVAGGCFWGMEHIIRKIPGVLDTQVGYTGGSTPGPTYEDVHSGATGHAEAVRIVFDPAALSYADFLEKWFYRMHDPTTRNRQGNDLGTQYRSAIFYTTLEQRKVAEEVTRRVEASGRWRAPIVTQIAAAGPFTEAEVEHQDYLEKHPDGYTCHFLRP